MRKIILFTVILYGFHSALAAIHSLRYVYTGTSGIPDFPEFVTVGLVDGEQIDYYDSNIRRTIPRVEWMEKSEGKDYWDGQTQIAIGAEQNFKKNIEEAKKRFNQTGGGIHSWQMMYGCEWDDDTGTTRAHEQFGYNGKDFLALDFKTMSYVAPVRQALTTTLKWNNNRALIEDDSNYYNHECIEWLKKYVYYGKETLQRKVRPEVSLLQKDSSSAVSCHATGFFPKSIVISWQKDGREMHDDVETTEVLPNGDGTFQIRSILRVSPEDMKNHQFSCTVEHVSLDEKIDKPWIAAPGINLLPIIIIVCVAALLVLAAVTAVAVFLGWRSKKKYYGKARFPFEPQLKVVCSDSGSEKSDDSLLPGSRNDSVSSKESLSSGSDDGSTKSEDSLIPSSSLSSRLQNRPRS